jgi:hypothetical protein
VQDLGDMNELLESTPGPLAGSSITLYHVYKLK